DEAAVCVQCHPAHAAPLRQHRLECAVGPAERAAAECVGEVQRAISRDPRRFRELEALGEHFDVCAHGPSSGGRYANLRSPSFTSVDAIQLPIALKWSSSAEPSFNVSSSSS